MRWGRDGDGRDGRGRRDREHDRGEDKSFRISTDGVTRDAKGMILEGDKVEHMLKQHMKMDGESCLL